MAGKLRVTLKKSSIDRPAKQKATLKALGLLKINQSVEVQVNPQMEGMIRVVSHLVSVEQI
jgi:large subunit ribosomal protein L30